MKYTINNLEETERFATLIGQKAQAGDVLILTGDLGAGKTTLTKGIAKGLGITRMVKSPTYTIIREYREGRLPLYHMDVYRIESGADELGLEEYFEGDGLSVVEWGNLLQEERPQDYLELILARSTDEDARTITTQPFGPESERLAAAIDQGWTDV